MDQENIDSAFARRLLEDRDGLRVSAFLPMVVAGNEVQQNPIRYKNMLRKVEESLSAIGADDDTVEEILEPLKPKLDDNDFFQHQDCGLVIFAKRGDAEFHRLGLDLDENVVAGGQFHVLPLLPLMNPGACFSLLAISQNCVQLFSGDRYRLRQVRLPEDTPQSLTEAVGREREEQHLQYHTGGGQAGSPIYHGQGGGKDDIGPELRRFARLVGECVNEVVGVSDLPLLLAGDPSLLAEFRETMSDDLDIMPDTLHGNFDRADAEELHEQALPIIKARQQELLRNYAERYAERSAAETGSDIFSSVDDAARQGRVESLLIRLPSASAEPPPADSPSDDEVNELVGRVLENGGEVVGLTPHMMPTDHRIAAIYRY